MTDEELLDVANIVVTSVKEMMAPKVTMTEDEMFFFASGAHLGALAVLEQLNLRNESDGAWGTALATALGLKNDD